MDSLTQITLGAAVGEAVLGRKVGNRAMLWGAIAGTIPDLDVFSNLVTDEISALAFHRAFTHSLAFALLAPPLLALAVYRIYGGKDGPLYGSQWRLAILIWLLLCGILIGGSAAMPIDVHNDGAIGLVIGTIIFGVIGLIGWRENLRKKPSPNGNASYLGWLQLFFWAILTHPLLDACTTYGTQLFEPFSALRVGWNNISVADPAYTFPFLLLVIAAGRSARESRRRRQLNYLGIAISTAYLLFTGYNKYRVDQVMEATIAAEEIQAERFMTTPTILNNVLWHGAVETADAYHLGLYSLLDSKPRFDLHHVAKNHDLLAGYWDEREVRIIRWFSNGYFSVMELSDSTLQINDLRYGTFSGDGTDPESYIFKWTLAEENGELRIYQSRGSEDQDMSQAFTELWTRIKGN